MIDKNSTRDSEYNRSPERNIVENSDDASINSNFQKTDDRAIKKNSIRESISFKNKNNLFSEKYYKINNRNNKRNEKRNNNKNHLKNGNNVIKNKNLKNNYYNRTDKRHGNYFIKNYNITDKRHVNYFTKNYKEIGEYCKIINEKEIFALINKFFQNNVEKEINKSHYIEKNKCNNEVINKENFYKIYSFIKQVDRSKENILKNNNNNISSSNKNEIINNKKKEKDKLKNNIITNQKKEEKKNENKFEEKKRKNYIENYEEEIEKDENGLSKEINFNENYGNIIYIKNDEEDENNENDLNKRNEFVGGYGELKYIENSEPENENIEN